MFISPSLEQSIIRRCIVNTCLSLLSLSCVSSTWAFTCNYTLVKDSCWTKYNVTVDIIDAKNTQVLKSVSIPSGKSWTRAVFNCATNGQTLMFRAQFSPVIWADDKGGVYYAKNYVSLPNKVNPDDASWNITTCFPSDFSEVPTPPDASQNCACNFSVIPALKGP